MKPIKCKLPTSIPAIGELAEKIGPNYTWTQAYEDCAKRYPAYLEDFEKHHSQVDLAEMTVKTIIQGNLPFPVYTVIDVGAKAKYQFTQVGYKWEDDVLMCVFHFTQF